MQRRSSQPPSGFQLLVVEDDLDLAANLSEVLSALPGVMVTVCAGGGAALELVQDLVVDLAVVSARLPDMGGVAVMAGLRRVDPSTELIFISGDASLETAVAAVREGAVGYLQKPFRPEDLRTLVNRALGQIAQRRDRDRLQHELTRSEALYRGVVDGVPAFVMVLDAGGDISMCNRYGEQLLGVEPGALRGARFEDWLAAGAGRKEFGASLARLQDGRPSVELELSLRNGRLLRLRLAPFVLSVGAREGVLALGEDLTDRRDLERRAVEAESLASVGQLTAGLAHEIRNPLNAASLQLELIRRGLRKVSGPVERLVERVDVVKLELSRLTALLNDFLNLARPRTMARKRVAVQSLFAHVLDLQQAAADAVGAAIRTQIDTGCEHVAGDADALTQVLINLVVNALEAVAGRGGAEVLLSASAEGPGRITLAVHDNGPGIEPDVAERLFEPFVTSKAAGTGLGLTVVRRIVERHGGSIRAGRDVEGRTVVRFTLDAPAPE